MKEVSPLIPLLLGPCPQASMLDPRMAVVRTHCPSGCSGTDFHPQRMLPLPFVFATFSSTNIRPNWRLVGSHACYGGPCR